MAAGSFLFENKLRPGCYIQIKGVPKASSDMSERGTVAILMNSDSGGLITELSANDILTGSSASKGFPLSSFTDTKSILNYVYPYVNKLVIGRLNSGGTKASVVLIRQGSGIHQMRPWTTDSTGAGQQSAIDTDGNDYYKQDGCTYTATGVPDGVSDFNVLWDSLDKIYFGYTVDVAPVTFGDIKLHILSTTGTPLLTAQAKFDGTFGNKLSVIIVAEAAGEGKYHGQGFFLRTSIDGEVVDEQNIKLPSEIKDNDYVTFIKAQGLTELSAIAAADLSGGTNGSESDTNLTKILSKLSGMAWNTLGFCGKDENRAVIETYIRNLRENKGKYRQGVIFDWENADYEGIISPFQAFAVDDDDVELLEAGSTEEAVAALELRKRFVVGFVAAITAGADVNISNTYHDVPQNVIDVIPIYDEDEDVEDLLRLGAFVFSHDSDGNIVVEKDINTLHTYTQTRTQPFSKNRVIRALDELSNTKVMIWERNFIGKIDNDDMGRTLLYNQILKIVKNLINIGAFADYDYSIVVEQGEDVDKVRTYEQVRPIDSMEQLYSYVTVLG